MLGGSHLEHVAHVGLLASVNLDGEPEVGDLVCVGGQVWESTNTVRCVNMHVDVDGCQG